MNVMTGTSLQQHRRGAGWTQARLADRLGVTQAYLSLMERGRRRVPDRLAQAATRLLRLPATTLPLPAYAAFDTAVAESWVEQSLSRLGYPGFAHRRHPGVTRNPVEVLLRALAFDDLDPRLAEALPWLLLRFEDLVFETLATRAKIRDLQNRLGFTVALARQVSEKNPAYRHRAKELRHLEAYLEPSRLAREDTYGRRETSGRMRVWLRENRSDAASHWNLLTDLRMEHLPYADQDPGALAELHS